MDIKINPHTVKALRRSHHWTQDELAVASGLSLRTIQRAESEGATSAATLKSLAAVFSVEAKDLEPDDLGVSEAAGLQIRPPRGARWGAALGIGGAHLGLFLSTYRQIEAVQAGHLSPDQFGLSVGILSAMTGLTSAAIGIY